MASHQPPLNQPRQFNMLPRFLLYCVVGFLCLMPAWYYMAPWLSAPVFYLAGESCSTLFRWVVTYERTNSVGMLITDLRVVVGQGLAQAGLLAPVVDYRLQGYGTPMLWAMLFASRPVALWRKLVLGTAVLWILQAVGVSAHWLNDVLNRSGPEVLARTSVHAWGAEMVAFYFHFNLFILTALAPIILWVFMNRQFVSTLRSGATCNTSA